MKAIYLLAAFMGMSSFTNANTISLTSYIEKIQTTNDEIVATITKNTTEQQFDELVNYFSENDIEIDLSKIEYNENNEITSIKISLKKGKQQSNFGLSQNTPISEIELGQKDGRLFIQSKNSGMTINGNSIADLFSQFGSENPFAGLFDSDAFSFNFDTEEIENFMNNDFQNFDFNELRDQFFAEREENANTPQNSANNGMPTYNFINKPGINKLIIIDGKESDFNTLNRLAKQNLLTDVDNLKAATAMSIYGEKAKGGAIIATTK